MKKHKLHLVSHVLCPYVQRSVIVLHEKKIAYTRTNIDLANTPAWFEQISPMGRVPVLQIDQSQSLFESSVICEFINEITPGSLHPEDPFDKAHHRAWIEFGSGILDSIGGLYNASNREIFESKRIDILRKFALVELEISGKPYFSGTKFHLIDAVYGPIFRYFYTFDRIIDLGIFDHLPKVTAWRDTLNQRQSIQRAVADEYPELLMQFLKERQSYISSLISKKAA